MSDEKDRVPEEEPEIKVRDRRRVTPEGEIRAVEEEAPPQETPAEKTAAEEKSKETEEKPERPSPLYSLAQFMLMQWRMQAWAAVKKGASGQPLSLAEEAEFKFATEVLDLLGDRLSAQGGLNETEKEGLRSLQETPADSYYELAKALLVSLPGLAWQGMGLVPDPLTNLLVTNLSQARVAIDLFSAILDKLEASGQLSDQERREFRGVKSNLQVNFVQRAGA